MRNSLFYSKLTKFLLYASILLVIFSCKKESIETDLSRLQAQRNLWEKQNIKAYSIAQQMHCFCPVELVAIFEVTVSNGQIIQVDGEPYTPEQHAHLKSIDETFAYLESRLQDTPDHFTIEYEATYGFPLDFYIDQSEMMADEEIGYSFSNFRILD